MKKTSIFLILLLICLSLSGCARKPEATDIAATTLPVFEFTQALCHGTDLTVGRLISEPVSCLHDYSLNVNQVRQAESADLIILSGAGLEEFMEDILAGKPSVDASQGISLLEGEAHDHDGHDHEEEHAHDAHEEHHHHEDDPHIWLSPANAKIMAQNIAQGLSQRYPAYADTFRANLDALLGDLDVLDAYGKETLSDLSCRELIPFHDGFSYFAQAFDLTILEAVEEESGSEASAQELIHLIEDVREHHLPAIFTETSGSTSAAQIISRETGRKVYSLDMAMAGDSYFDAMYHNINTIKEALG